MEGSVYILQSQKNLSYYIGSTINIASRLIEHNTGKVTYTRNLTPWVLIFFKVYPDIKTARQIEYKIKKLKNKKNN